MHWYSIVIIVGVFIAVVVILLMEKMNRAILALTGSIICYFVLIFVEHEKFTIFVEFLFGTPEDNYVSLHSLILILGMSIIVSICHQAGFFQFISFRLVLLIANRPKLLMFMLCTITVFVSAILNNILTAIIMIPLIITISRILAIDPEPYIITQGVLINIGGTVFTISSIPNILISSSANISFIDHFLNVGILSFGIYLITTAFFYLLYRKKLHVPKENIRILKEFNAWNFVPSKALLYKSVSILGIVLLGLMLIPTSIITPDIIAISGAAALIILSRLEPEKIILKIDTELFLYLMGIFIIAGSLEKTGLIQLAGQATLLLSKGNSFFTIIFVLWVSAILSSTIDNIPITKVLIPAVHVITAQFPLAMRNMTFFSLSIGANWGDNLTPMGDNILVMNLAERNKRPIRMKEFWRVGFITTIFQLLWVTVYFSLRLNFLIGLILLILLLGSIGAYLFYQYRKFFTKESMKKLFAQFKIQKKVKSVKTKIDSE